jgi:hypothetical protein
MYEKPSCDEGQVLSIIEAGFLLDVLSRKIMVNIGQFSVAALFLLIILFV